MTITIDDRLEKQIREQAEAEGLSVSEYVERLVAAHHLAPDELTLDELETLALEGLNSGEPIEGTPAFWEGLHRELDDRLKQTTPR